MLLPCDARSRHCGLGAVACLALVWLLVPWAALARGPLPPPSVAASSASPGQPAMSFSPALLADFVVWDSKAAREAYEWQRKKENRLVLEKWSKFFFDEQATESASPDAVQSTGGTKRKENAVAKAKAANKAKLPAESWKHYKGILRVEFYSGGSCNMSDEGKTLEVELVVHEKNNPRKIEGYIFGDKVQTGRFEGTGGQMALRYPFVDGREATGHWLNLGEEQGTLRRARINETNLPREIQRCNWEEAFWEGQLVSEGDEARSRFLDPQRRYDKNLEMDRAEQDNRELYEQYAKIRAEIDEIRNDADAPRLVALQQERKALARRMLGPTDIWLADITHDLGEAYLKAGDAHSAKAEAMQALAMQQFGWDYQLLLEAQTELKDEQGALETLRAWDAKLAQTPWNTERRAVANSYLERLGGCLDTGRQDECIGLLRSALAIDRRHRPLVAANELGWIMALQMAKGETKAAEQSFREAMAIVRSAAKNRQPFTETHTSLVDFSRLKLMQPTPWNPTCLAMNGFRPTVAAAAQGLTYYALEVLSKHPEKILPFLYCANGFDSGVSSLGVNLETSESRNAEVTNYRKERKELFSPVPFLFYDLLRPENIGLATLVHLVPRREVALNSLFTGDSSHRSMLLEIMLNSKLVDNKSHTPSAALDKLVEFENEITDIGKAALINAARNRALTSNYSFPYFFKINAHIESIFRQQDD